MIPHDPNAPRDFDFFMGSWKVRHRRLKDRLIGCTEWETFNGICVAHTTLGGFGNVDDNVLELPSGQYRAMTIRSYNVEQSTWSIWWLDGRHPHRLDVPVVGRFEKGLGYLRLRTYFTESRFRSDSFGAFPKPIRRGGNRLFLQMQDKLGKPIGSWTLQDLADTAYDGHD